MARRVEWDNEAVKEQKALDTKDKSLADLDNLPDPDLLAARIIENLHSAVESFKEIMASINGK